MPRPRKRRPTSHPTFLEAAEGHLNNQQWREALGMLRGSKTLHQQGGVRWTQEEEVQWALAYNAATDGLEGEKLNPRPPALPTMLVHDEGATSGHSSEEEGGQDFP